MVVMLYREADRVGEMGKGVKRVSVDRLGV
jgi:hypothetical protein